MPLFGRETGVRLFSRATDFRHQARDRASFYEFVVVPMERVPIPFEEEEVHLAAGLSRQDAVVDLVESESHDEDQVETSQDKVLPKEEFPACLDGFEHAFVCFHCGFDLPDDVPMSRELNYIMNPFVKGSGSTGVSQNLWIPLVGRHVAGKD